jgi:hypothetical protein
VHGGSLPRLITFRLTSSQEDLIGLNRSSSSWRRKRSANESQLRSMLQTLLSQRFKLVMHRETREMPVYALTVAKGVPKLLELTEGDAPPSTAKEKN